MKIGNIILRPFHFAMEKVLESDFDKIKASKKYSVFEKLKFAVIFPLRAHLSDNTLTELKFYKEHQELCAGIEKVKSAYNKYIAAEAAVKNLKKDQPEVANLANRSARLAGKALVESYDALIELAADQARCFGLNDQEHKKDLHTILDSKGVMPAIHQTRIKMAIAENGFIETVSNMVELIEESSSKLGTQDRKDLELIREAYISGAASMPGLGKDVMNYHAELLKLQTPGQSDREQMEINLIDAFTRQLEELMKGPFEAADLKKIQVQGIPLSAVIDMEGKSSLLINLREKRQDLLRLNEQIQACESKQNLADSSEYTVNDVSTLLLAASNGSFERNEEKKAWDLSTAQDTDLLFDAVPALKVCRDYVKLLVDFDKKIYDLLCEIAKLDKVCSEHIVEADELVHSRAAEVAALEKAIVKSEEGIANAIALLEQYDQAYVAMSTQKERGKKLNPGQWFLKFTLAAGNKKLYQDGRKQLEDRINELHGELAQMRSTVIRKRTPDDIAVLSASIESEKRKKDETLQKIIAMRNQVAEQKITLSGNDVKALLDSLGFVRSNAELASPLYHRVCDVTRKAIPIDDLRFQARTIRGEIEQLLQKVPGVIYDERSGMFRMEVFGETEKQKISTLIDSNLAIGREMTLRIGDKIVSNWRKHREILIQKVKNPSAKRALQGRSKLEARLKAIPRIHQGLDLQIIDRISRLSGVNARSPNNA